MKTVTLIINVTVEVEDNAELDEIIVDSIKVSTGEVLTWETEDCFATQSNSARHS